MIFSKKFISRTAEFTTLEKNIPAPYFRKSFSLEKLPESAEITICGLGFYELYLNGEKITKGRLAPYISNPDDLLYYDRYEIAGKLQAGENVIGILLGNGFLNNPGGYVWDFEKAPYRSAPKVALAFEADEKLLFEADESFKTAPSPILFDDYRMGEIYDARKEISGWNRTGFDDSNWQNAISATSPKGEPRIAEVEPIEIGAEYEPTEIIESEGGYLYRFSYNIAGVCRLNITAAAGQKIVLTHGEFVKDGKLELENICFNDETSLNRFHRDEYLCKDGKQSYMPSFAFHGFQYVFVEGVTEKQATKGLLTALFLHSDLQSAGEFSCSNETVNKIQENTRRSTLSNFYYFPMDCPQREKNGWTGDAALSAEQIMLNFSAETSLREWLRNIRAAQTEEGELPGIVPTSGWGFEWGNGPAWDTVIVQLPYYIYKYTENREVLEENFSAIYRYFKYAMKKADGDGLFAYGLGDWCQTAHEWDYDTDLRITDTLTLMDFCEKAERISFVLGKEKEEKEFAVARERIKSAFRKAFVIGGKIKEEFATQTSVAMAIHYRAIEETEISAAKEQLLALIKEKDFHFDVGVLGARTLFRVLSDLNEPDLALEMIVRPDFPSFGYHVNRGATTLWEGFLELREDKIETKSGCTVKSINHHFWGDISAWFYRCLGGININPDFTSPKTIVIDPVFPKDVDWVKASRICSNGVISVEWKRIDGKIELKVNAPKNYIVIDKYAERFTGAKT